MIRGPSCWGEPLMASREIQVGTLTLQLHRQLLANGAPVPLGRKPLEILSVLASAHGGLVTKDELLEAVWPRQVVEENVIHVHMSALRKALGAEADRLKTVYGMGYRLDLPSAATPIDPAAAPATERPPSIAVLPLRLVGSAGQYAVIAEALPHELIAEFSRLRWLFVIARGSSFQFRDAEPDIRQVGALLGCHYCLSGTLEIADNRIAITVELSDTRSLQVVWGERYTGDVDGIHELRASIVACIIAALEIQIPLHEAQLADLKAPEHLDAWALYHLGLRRMYRSTKTDNAAAAALFEQAIAHDPHFARAQVGLSFTHFQNAFMRYESDVDREAQAARRFAEQALDIDTADPAANLALGRSLWLHGDHGGGLPWVDRALALSPNYAQAAYAHAFSDAMLCRGASARIHADRAMALSPMDPMHYAMLGTRAWSHALRGEHGEAAGWADRAARAPNAHVMMAMIAVACHSLAGDDARADDWARTVRARNPALTADDFFRAFPLEEPDVRAQFAQAIARFGF